MAGTELYDCLLDVVKKRRSVRYFKPDPVPDEFITKIIEAARWAPSGFHTQPWEFVVIRNKDIRDKVIEALAPPIRRPDWTPAETSQNAPVFIILLADWRARVGLPDPAQSSDSRVHDIYLSGLASAFLLMHLAAAALGLASRWYSSASHPKTESRIKEIIGIPEGLKIYDMMCVGFPARPAIPKIVRELEGMVHYDDCGVQDFRTDEEVAAYAARTREWCLSAH
jgi:nitroreductase